MVPVSMHLIATLTFVKRLLFNKVNKLAFPHNIIKLMFALKHAQMEQCRI